MQKTEGKFVDRYFPIHRVDIQKKIFLTALLKLMFANKQVKNIFFQGVDKV